MSAQYPPYSTADAASAGGPAPAAPKQVTIAFWLYLGAAAISLISLILSLGTVDSMKAALQRQLESQGSQTLDDAALDAAVGVAIGISVVIGLLFIAAFVLFAFFMRRGANWARIVLAVITALSLFEVLSGNGLGAVRVALGVVATVLIFMPPANEFFNRVKASKAH